MVFSEQRWAQLCERLGIQAHHRFSQIEQAYAEPQRAYHTAQHIDECLVLFDQVASGLQDEALVELCIWLHDLVYQPQRSDNEAQSAELAVQWCSGLSSQRLEKLGRYILATQGHAPAKQDSDLQALLDIDLSILASSPERFKQYGEQIRFEYSFVPETIYAEKRQQFLEQLGKCKPLFHHPALAASLEETARENLP